MRVLVLTNRFPRPGHEGDAPYNGYQLDALAERHEVCAVVPVPWPERLQDVRGGGAGGRSVRGHVAIEHPTYWYPPRVLQGHYGKFFLRSVRRTVLRVARDFRPEVIFACWAHPDGWAAWRLGREIGIPVVTKVIGSDVLVLARDRERRARIAEGLQGADEVLAVSRDLADHVIRLGLNADRVHVVPEGTCFERFGPGAQTDARRRTGLARDSSPRVLFVGNLLMSKGAGVLLEACALLRRRGVAFSCHLVGRGRDEPQLRALAARLGLGPELVDFAGPCPQERLADWYRAADLVALPSFSEGVPNVLREAMACGRRFVATRVGGIPEVTRPGVGTLVEAGDAAQLADELAAGLSGGAAAVAAAEPLALAASAELNVSWERSAQMVAEHLNNAVVRRRVASAPSSPAVGPIGSSGDRDALKEGDVSGVRILGLTQVFPRVGHETMGVYNELQFGTLARQGNACIVVAPRPWVERFMRRSADDDLAGRDGAVSLTRPWFYYPPRLAHAAYGRYYLASVRGEIRRKVAAFRPDAIFACWSHPDGWAAVRLGREHNLPVLVKVHGSDILVLTRNPRRRRRIAEALCAADAVLAVSRDLAERVRELGVDGNRIYVVPHGTQLRVFRPGDLEEAAGRLGLSRRNVTSESRRVLFVGNLLMSKGAGVLLEACALLRRRGVAFSCHLVGRGRDEPQLRALAARLGLGPELVDFAGPCPQERLADWYRAADLVALPSFSEGVPNVLREAMACGRRFVATRVGGIPEVTRPGVGTLVEAGDAAQLADELAAGLSGGAAAVAAAEPLALAASAELNVSWERSAQMVAEIVRQVRDVRITQARLQPRSSSGREPCVGGRSLAAMDA